jgi:hypothetical protein
MTTQSKCCARSVQQISSHSCPPWELELIGRKNHSNEKYQSFSIQNVTGGQSWCALNREETYPLLAKVAAAVMRGAAFSNVSTQATNERRLPQENQVHPFRKNLPGQLTPVPHHRAVGPIAEILKNRWRDGYR